MNPKQMLFDFGTLANVKRDRSNDEYIANSLSKKFNRRNPSHGIGL